MPFDGKYMTSCLWAIVMFALSLTVYEIFANKIKYQKFDLEMNVNINDEKNRTWAV